MSSPTIISVGELLVEFVSHQKGCELRELSQFSGPYPSGAPAICIDQAARIGAATKLFGAIGSDNFGQALLDRLIENGVQTSGIQRREDKTTGVAFVSYFNNGDRTFIFHLSNTAADDIDHTEIQLPDGPLIMHFSGSSLGNPKLRNAIVRTAAEVIAKGGKLSCDPNVRPELMSDPDVKPILTSLLTQSSYLFPSDSDLQFLYPDVSQETAIAALSNQGVEIVALTRGDQGSVIYSGPNEPLRLDGHSVDEIDPTGAGDCFCGTFLAMMAKGLSIEVCGKYANAAGAIAVTKRGPMEGNSDLKTIEAFIKDHPAN